MFDERRSIDRRVRPDLRNNLGGPENEVILVFIKIEVAVFVFKPAPCN